MYASHPYPVLQGRVDDNSPPPSYEDVMGQYQSLVNQSQHELPPLSHIDIMPRCIELGAIENKVPPKFESLSEVISHANQWLDCNTNVSVWKCETVERKVEKGTVINSDSTLIHESTYGFNVYVIGLRLWLTKKQNETSPSQKLAVYNVIPRKKEVPLQFRAGFMGGAGIVGGSYILGPGIGHGFPTQITSWTTYEGLNKTLERANEDLATSPLQGKILNVETSTIKIADCSKVVPIDPECTCWYENGAKPSKRYTQILRVFYTKGPPVNDQILMHDIKPEITSVGDLSKKSKFQPITDIIQKTGTWIKSLAGIRVINLETRTATIHEFGGETVINTDCTDELDSKINDKRYLRFIRIFYTVDSSQSYSNTVLTSRLFYPMRTGVRSFEGMMDTMKRIEAWLRITRLPIFDIETVNYLHHPDVYIGLYPDKSDLLVPQGLGKYWLTAVRIYFPGPYTEPSPLLLPSYLDWKLHSAEYSQCCCVS